MVGARSRPGAAGGGAMKESLGEAFPREIARVKEVLGYYREIGPAGAWAVGEIARDLQVAEIAWTEQDTVAMIRMYPTPISIVP